MQRRVHGELEFCPAFPMSHSQVRLSEASLNFALLHIEKYGDTDVFPPAFEIGAIKHFWNDFRPLLEEDMQEYPTQTKRISTGSFMSTLFPKHSTGFRNITQLDPVETLRFTALVHQFGGRLEGHRLPKQDNIVFSYRFQPDSATGQLFDPQYNYRAFQDHCLGLASDPTWNFVVTADIADFYSRLYSHRLENCLDVIQRLEIEDPDERRSFKSFSKMMSRLQLKWACQQSYGLPIGCEATRLLADTMLTDVDFAMRDACLTIAQDFQETAPVYCRFSDDFRFFCFSKRSAIRLLQQLAMVLHNNHNLSLQSHKTSFWSRVEFQQHLAAVSAVGASVHRILKPSGLGSYHSIDVTQLSPSVVQELRSLDLAQALRTEIQRASTTPILDTGFVDFLLKWLAHIEDWTIIVDVFNPAALDVLYPCIRGLVALCKQVPKDYRSSIGSALLEHLSSGVGVLPITRASFLWAISSAPDDFGFKRPVLRSIYEKNCHEVVQSMIFFVAAHSKDVSTASWISNLRDSFSTMGGFSRRSFLFAARQWSGDHAHSWSQSVRYDMTILEMKLLKWLNYKAGASL
eukprot:GILK01005028.1.p1 GENE.GILK01005028.1~~GILK01005028.1.p1  ORF type:complete len:574 (+),score=41.64 GILK01005028.1:2-1723(+)